MRESDPSFLPSGLVANAEARGLTPCDGGVPEWLKGTDCKSVGFAYAGSNPAPSTTTRKDGRSPASFLEGSSWTRTSFGCCRGNGEQEGTAEGGSATLQGDEALVSA